MHWYDWLIVIIPTLFVLGMGIWTRRYLKDVTTFLSAGRVCGRYVISIGDIASALSIIGLLGYVEIHYKTGFAVGFWSSITLPLGVLMGLFGYCTYRFRETKAQSIGQFLELRYSRNFRIFAAALRSLSEMLANMIMPALAARFFIYLLGLPETFSVLGVTLATFDAIMVLVLVMAISIICFGGSMAIIVTDTIQGFICYPLMALFVVFVLYKFSWGKEILPVMAGRVPTESFLNPFDAKGLKDFNYFSVLVLGVMVMFIHRSSWTGAGGSSSAARSPHEQKMAGLLGTWRGAIGGIFYVLLGIALLAFLNHVNFEKEAHQVRSELAQQIATGVLKDRPFRQAAVDAVRDRKPVSYDPAVDKPQSEANNVDKTYLDGVRKAMVAGAKAEAVSAGDNTESKLRKAEGVGNKLFQEFRTLYYQQMLPVALRHLLPGGLLGLFCLLMVLAMVSTDDSRIFSATITISQDVIMPFRKQPLTPRQHMWVLRIVAICIGVFFFFGSKYMRQLDYIQLYVTLVCNMWLGGCGPVIVFGLYSRFGTTRGAWVSLVTGTVMAVVGALVQRNWADVIVPFLQQQGIYDSVGQTLATISAPLNPLISWKMSAVKCPINSYEWYFFTMVVTLILYCGVSLLERKQFNLDRMLHRGEYSIDGEKKIKSAWTRKNLYDKLIGITPEYTFWDRVIAWAYFYYSIVYRFGLTFIAILIWNAFDPWPLSWWGWKFFITTLIIPGFMAAFTAVWFGICGFIDLRQMFRDLEARAASPLDDGSVEGGVSLADKAAVDAIDKSKNAGKQ